jgi:hypothetical protein
MSANPPCGEISYEANSFTAFGSAMKGAASAFGGGGQLIAGMLQPSMSIRQFRCYPGKSYDYRTFYRTETTLLIMSLVLIIAIFLSSSK